MHYQEVDRQQRMQKAAPGAPVSDADRRLEMLALLTKGNQSMDRVSDNAARMSSGGIVVAPSVAALPFEVLPDQDERKKKIRNALKRKKHKDRKKNQ
jgi:hypothetical protein